MYIGLHDLGKNVIAIFLIKIAFAILKFGGKKSSRFVVLVCRAAKKWQIYCDLYINMTIILLNKINKIRNISVF